MNLKHTPGPWTFTVIGEHDGKPIGDVKAGDSHVADLVYAHDAALIAAAPDLIAALAQLVQAVEFGNPGGLAQLRNGPVMSDARAAIAKAEGRQ